ncbi:MAG: 2-phosphosulfolactate phosphatase [Anaerolineae bacterium]|nr:2-phosphosulfolactate phosphatase [Anaerolineae bacterium]
MKLYLELGAPGARRAAARGDVTVIIDALRASTTICAALAAGAVRVKTVLTVGEALAFCDNPSYCIVGERGGVKVDGFQFGNSPVELLANRDEIEGKTVVITTTNGTRCINAALSAAAHSADTQGAGAILIGAPANAAAVAYAAFSLAQANGCDVTLVAAGLHDQARDEDMFSQALLAHRLRALGAHPPDDLPTLDEANSPDVFLRAESGQYLIGLGYEADVHLCAEIDRWDLAPIYCQGYLVEATQSQLFDLQ